MCTRKIEVFNVRKDFLRAIICLNIYIKRILYVLLSGFAAARLIEIVTNRRRHARWRWNYIDECMFVQLTRPPLLLYVCTPGHGFWKSCVWRCDHFRLLGIWFYSRWRITAYILSPISSLIKNSIYFFFLFFCNRVGTYTKRVFLRYKIITSDMMDNIRTYRRFKLI